ncbi:hypothetical protein BDQ17DRAFT_953594 [Cyathus striatus]|nr:hypothetical protein BDQ17DRAFT_953594 [Cyathus striatus]
MFGSAKNFVIQSGATFIDIGKQCNVKKVYYRRSSCSNLNTLHQDNSQILLNRDYKQIKKGDINILECINGPVQKGSLYYDFIVEVSGENKRKVAWIYHGQRGGMQLKKELEMLSKMWPHPSIPQVFGIYKSNDTIGFVFHGDSTRTMISHACLTSDLDIGTYQRHSEYMQSLQPLQCAAFYILYVSPQL